jgi:hypothetical protein
VVWSATPGARAAHPGDLKEIDGKPVQAKLISAILMGTRLPIDKGKTPARRFHCRSPARRDA